MSTNAVTTTTTFETIRFCEREAAAAKLRTRLGVQFWSCTILSSFFTLLGAWVFYSAKTAGPAVNDLGGILATLPWICVPTLVYYAWQGYRQSTAVVRHGNANHASVQPAGRR